MSLLDRYQDFGARTVAADDPPADDGSELAIEEMKLESFEAGYKAGWDDSMKAQTQTRAHVGEVFAKSLTEARYSYDEARFDLASELRSVIEPILSQLLPKLAQETLGVHIIEQMHALQEEVTDREVEIFVAPKRRDALEALLEDWAPDAPNIISDSTLGPDQAFIRIGRHEREINFEVWLQQILDTTRSYFDKALKERPDV